MSNIDRIFGHRLRNLRQNKKLSQEKLADLSGCHPSYIGQLERGEKNPSLESVHKVVTGLGITLSEFFSGIDGSITVGEDKSPANKCHEYIESKSYSEQKRLLRLLNEIDKYSENR